MTYFTLPLLAWSALTVIQAAPAGPQPGAAAEPSAPAPAASAAPVEPPAAPTAPTEAGAPPVIAVPPPVTAAPAPAIAPPIIEAPAPMMIQPAYNRTTPIPIGLRPDDVQALRAQVQAAGSNLVTLIQRLRDRVYAQALEIHGLYGRLADARGEAGPRPSLPERDTTQPPLGGAARRQMAAALIATIEANAGLIARFYAALARHGG